jgi:hypothetical protein
MGAFCRKSAGEDGDHRRNGERKERERGEGAENFGRGTKWGWVSRIRFFFYQFELAWLTGHASST